MKSTKPSYNLVRFALALALVVVILGAFTRLMDAGLGCPDWPGCYGHLWMPQTAEEIARADEAFPHAPFEQDKAWPEVVHRYFASALGFVIILVNVVAWRNRREHEQPVILPLALLGLVILQGMFGMWTVTLNLWPQVVMTHLLGGFATLSLLWLLSRRLQNRPWPQPTPYLRHWQQLRPWAMLGLALVVLQIALGGWTSANYAALACPDLPTCQGQWLPEMDFVHGFNFGQEIGPNYLGGQMNAPGRVAIHFAHRVGALVVVFYLAFLLSRLYRYAGGVAMTRQAHTILGLLVLQVALGLSNVFWSLPLPVAVAHNAVGALLLLSLVNLNYRLSKVSSW